MREALADLVPPDGLSDRILAAVREEKRRARRRASLKRACAVAAALLILVPAVTLPVFRFTRNAAPEAPVAPEAPEAPVAPADNLSLEATADKILCDAAVPTGETAGETLAAVQTTTAALPMFSPQPMYSTMSTTAPAEDDKAAPEAAEDTAEPAYFAVLRAQVGEEAFETWLSAYDGDPASPEAKAEAYAYFGLDE